MAADTQRMTTFLTPRLATLSSGAGDLPSGYPATSRLSPYLAFRRDHARPTQTGAPATTRGMSAETEKFPD